MAIGNLPPLNATPSLAAGGSKVANKAETTPEGVLTSAAANRSPNIQEAFWVQEPLDLTRWNKFFPYQFLVVEAKSKDNGDVTFQPVRDWQYTLPIAPTGYSESMIMASKISATLGGIRESNNSAKFRMISLRGSTGVLPGRSNGISGQRLTANAIETIFGGTVNQLDRVAQSAKSAVSSLTGTPTLAPNVHSSNDFDKQEDDASPEALIAKTTGWYQIRKLIQFIERYQTIKATVAGRNLHLALATWKDQSVQLVHPMGFEWSKDAGLPLSHTYNISLKAFRRITLEAGDFSSQFVSPVRRDPNKLAQVLNTLQDARRTVQGISKLADAAVGDINRLIFEPLREAVLFVKDILGAVISVAELPDKLAESTKTSWAGLTQDVLALDTASNQVKDKTRLQWNRLNSLAQEIKSLGSSNNVVARSNALNSHPAGKPFKSPKEAFELMSTMPVAQLKIPAAVQQLIDQELKRVRRTTRLDFEIQRNTIRDAADRLAIALGAGDATYEDTYSVTVGQIKEDPTDSDWDVLFALNNAAMAMDSLAATGDDGTTTREQAIEVMAGLARRSGIAFQVPRSKFPVQFPYRSSLEELAKNYLGDPDRWHEIAALNGLRAPYIDEVGFELPLLVNGVDTSATTEQSLNLYIGQMLHFESRAVPRFARRITDLREVGQTLVITVDGEPNLTLLKVVDGAKITAFLPDTVNSQQMIFIPSDREPAEEDFITKSIPGIDEFDPLIQAGGVDWLLDSNNDLVITPDGDSRLAAGMTNIIQNIRTALSVTQGTLLQHPSFGLPMQVGMSTADYKPKEVLDAVRRMLANDLQFDRVDSVQIRQVGPLLSITATVFAAGSNQPLPISFQLI